MSVLRSGSKLVPVLLVLILVLQLGGHLYLAHRESDSAAIAAREAARTSSDIQAGFTDYCAKTLQALENVRDQLASRYEFPLRGTVPEQLFADLRPSAGFDFSTELVNGHDRVIAWSGVHGPALDAKFFSNPPRLSFNQGPIYTYLIVVLPVGRDSSGSFRLVGERLFDVSYPINNQFISSDAFASTFTTGDYADVDFDFTRRAEAARDTAKSDSTVLVVPLAGENGQFIGIAYRPRADQSAVLEDIRNRIQAWTFLLIIIAATLLAWQSRKRLDAWPIPLRGVTVTGLLWFWRFVLLWTGIPSKLIGGRLFDPGVFTSSWGGGLAASVGDMFISAAVLILNVLYLMMALRVWGRDKFRRVQVPWPARIAVVLFSAAALVCLLRILAAIIHTAVFDAELSYNDPRFVFPPYDLAVMLASLFGITASVLFAGIGLVTLSYLFLDPATREGSGLNSRWLIILAAFLGIGAVAGLLPYDLLLSPGERIVAITGIILVTRLVLDLSRPGSGLFQGRSLTILIITNILLFVPFLDRQVHEHDTTHVELLGAEVVRPQNGSLSSFISEALDQLASPEAGRILTGGSPGDVEKMAFTQWAKSVLSREGNNCSVVYMDRNGKAVSTFHLGVAPAGETDDRTEISPTKRYIEVANRNLLTSERWDHGYAPIFGDDSVLVGGVWIGLSSGKELIMRGEAPEILKNYSQEHFETHFRRLFISEYYDGKLIISTNESFPRNRALPLRVADIGPRGTWVTQTFDGEEYETLLLRDSSARNVCIALSLEPLDFRWHLYSFLRYILFYLCCCLVIALVSLPVRLLRKRLVVTSIRTRLMVAFIAVSLIPLIIIGYYNRAYAIEREQNAVIMRLDGQSAVVAEAVQRHQGLSTPFTLAKLTDKDCQAIADEIDIDFNVYADRDLQASSKPEMVVAGLMDDRLSADGYVNVMMRQKGFFWEEQSIGTLPYIVGYRPLTAENGAVIGAVGVPTLYHLGEIDEELTRRNIFLFGAYALAILLSVIVGTLLMRKISGPIIRLTEATRSVAAGNLDVDIRSRGSDEIAELEAAFGDMTRDLRRSQEEMVRVQRELAWKEMARQIAHEIKNPLTPMKLSLQHLRQMFIDRKEDFGRQFQEVSNTVLQQIEALSRIASEFSDFARLPARHMTSCPVEDVLEEARHLFEQYPGIMFRSDFHVPSGKVRADREELRRVFVNIVRNAVQAMREEGTITFSTQESGGWVEIRIIDSGPGIPPEIHRRLFEPNFSTKTEGMGLGLTIAKKTVEDFGGTISLAGLPSGLPSGSALKGTTVTIRLPLIS